jgi:nucleoside-diphosphate-sugar epimerase
VLDACRAHGIGKLVYTSTPSVTHRATHPVEGGTPTTVPYGEDFKAPYAGHQGDRREGGAGRQRRHLATVALRPRLIWGPGDNQILPRLVERARRPAAHRRRRQNLVDTTYIDNAAQAHFDAFDHLAPGAACAGKAYFIQRRAVADARAAQRAARRGRRCRRGASPIPFKRGPAPSARSAKPCGRCCAEGRAADDALPGRTARTTHWYSMAPATRDFGYVPKVTIRGLSGCAPIPAHHYRERHVAALR